MGQRQAAAETEWIATAVRAWGFPIPCNNLIKLCELWRDLCNGINASRLYRYDHGQEFFRPETSAGVYSHGVIGGHCLGGHFVFHDGTSVGPSQR